MEVEGLRIERQDHTLVLTIASGEKNLASFAMMDAIAETIEGAGRDHELRFVRIRAEGEVFCLGREQGGTGPADVRATAQRIVRVNEACQTTPLTVVTEVNGDAAGFGVGMIGSSDVAVAADHATFAFPEIHGKFAPSVVISWASRYLPRRLVFDMVSTGEPVDAQTALGAGLVSEVVPAADLAARVDERLARLAEADAGALREVKRFMTLARSMDGPTAAAAAVDALVVSVLRSKAERE